MSKIDWDNLPICGESGLVLSPHFCQIDEGYHPPVDPPVNSVPIPGTLALVLIGVIAMAKLRKL